MRRPRLRACLATLLVIGTLVTAPDRDAPAAEAACTYSNLTADQLNAVFASPGVGRSATVPGYAGGDYQHIYPLPAGRRLWLFQDVFFSNDNDLRDSLKAAAHNAGLVQLGNCWSLVGGPGMKNYIGSNLTTPLYHWFWPMGGDIGADGMLWIFMAEMQNPRGTGAGYGTRPIGTWVARVHPFTMQVMSFTKAKDAGTRLYGWSVTSDANWSYLYGHCYRQYIYNVNSVAQFDSTCMPSSYLARVPKGRFWEPMQYWTGVSWSSNPSSARPVMTRGKANPMDVRHFGSWFVNVTKVDDWWGTTIYVDKAATAEGPWTPYTSMWIVDKRKCSSCGIYHAQFLPTVGPSGEMILSWSNGGPFNLWQANASLYRPSFVSIPVPS